MNNPNLVNTYYKTTIVTTVVRNPDNEKELVERVLVGKFTTEEIKELLDETETFVSVEYVDEQFTFDLQEFKELREQGKI